MKLISKIAIVILFTLLVNSCKKERTCPLKSKSEPATGSTQKSAVSPTDNSGETILKGAEEEETDGDDIVGSGDDDRDGGDKKPKKGNGNGG